MTGRVQDGVRRAPEPAIRRRPEGSPADARDPADPRLLRLLELQRSAGNAAVVQLVQGEGDAAGVGTGAAEQGDATSNIDATAEAKGLFDKGAAAYDARDYAHAYDYFAQAYQLASRPNLLFDQAQALRKLGGRREEAIALYEQYLAAGGGTRTEDATKALAELRTPEATGIEALDTAAGKELFDKGAAAYDARDYAHAYDCFAQAYQLASRPNLLFDQAQALRKLGGRREEAIALYEQYLAAGGGTRTEDATKALTELRTPESTGDVELDTAQAKTLFDQGAAAYEAGDFGHAADDFGEAYELAQRPGLLFSEAQALRRLGGRTADAIALYQQYLDTGEAKRGDEAQSHIAALQAQGAEPR